MFTIGQKVTCVDAENQPRLSEGKEYTVYDVTDNGVRVESTEGRIPYDYNRNRFEAVSEGMREHHAFDHNSGVLVINGVAYALEVHTNSVGQHVILNIARFI